MFATPLAADLLSAELAKHGEERQAGDLALRAGAPAYALFVWAGLAYKAWLKGLFTGLV